MRTKEEVDNLISVIGAEFNNLPDSNDESKDELLKILEQLEAHQTGHPVTNEEVSDWLDNKPSALDDYSS